MFLSFNEFEKVLFSHYIQDNSRIGSGLPLSESDKGWVTVCFVDIIHVLNLESDSQWLSAEKAVMTGRVFSVSTEMVSRLDQIVEEWMDEYQLEESNLRLQFSVQLSNASKSRIYYHEMVWEELFRGGSFDWPEITIRS
jgi:hypothetical protein